MFNDIELTDEQNSVFNEITEWINNETVESCISLGGLAGTGKTTLVSKILQNFGDRVISVCAPTGKAVQVLRKKGIHHAETVHKTIYQPIIEEVNGRKCVVGHTLRANLETALIICDEASMISDDVFNDLTSFGVKVLLVGDHGQLPPVKHSKSVDLINEPVLRLETPVRQALGNTIIKLAHGVRNDAGFDFFEVGGQVSNFKDGGSDYLSFDQIICATNKKRVQINKKVRKMKKFDPEKPVVGDRVVALEGRKISNTDIKNGQQFEIVNIIPFVNEDGVERFSLSIKSVDDSDLPVIHNVSVEPECFNNLDFQKTQNKDGWVVENKTIAMDYAYAITCHKSQGSEWDNVLVVCESWPFKYDERQRWLYTAFTRAKKTLSIDNSGGASGHRFSVPRLSKSY